MGVPRYQSSSSPVSFFFYATTFKCFGFASSFHFFKKKILPRASLRLASHVTDGPPGQNAMSRFLPSSIWPCSSLLCFPMVHSSRVCSPSSVFASALSTTFFHLHKTWRISSLSLLSLSSTRFQVFACLHLDSRPSCRCVTRPPPRIHLHGLSRSPVVQPILIVIRCTSQHRAGGCLTLRPLTRVNRAASLSIRAASFTIACVLRAENGQVGVTSGP